MRKFRYVAALMLVSVFAVNIIALMGVSPVVPASVGNGVQKDPSAAAGGNLVRNAEFIGAWQNDWVGMTLGSNVIKNQEVSTLARHYKYNWLKFQCEMFVTEQFSSVTTARDDAAESYATSVALTKTGDNHLKYAAALKSSGYAKAVAGDSDGVCSDSDATVSWSFNDLSEYSVRIYQTLDQYTGGTDLDYAVAGAKYKLSTTMNQMEDWHAQITWTLQAPDGSLYELRQEFFSSDVMADVERSFNEDVRSIFAAKGTGTYKLYIDMDFRIHHINQQSDSATGDNCVAETPAVTMDNTVALEIYDVSLVWQKGVAPPIINAISPNPDFDGDVTVSWNAVTGATSYDVYRAEMPFSDIGYASLVGSVDAPATSFLDEDLDVGTYYYGVVTQKAGDGSSGLSTLSSVQVILSPGGPNLLPPTTPDTDGEVTLQWDDVGGTYYKIFQSLTPITTVLGVEPTYVSLVNSYTIPALADNTYYFVVVAQNEAGDSPMSNQVSVEVVVAGPPAVPVLAAIEEGVDTDGKVHVSWSAVTGALSYKVYRETAEIVSLDGLTPIVSTVNNTWVDQMVDNGETYYYVVVASNYKGDSSASVCQSVLIDIPHILDNVREWVQGIDPTTRSLVFSVVELVLGETGKDLQSYLLGNSNSFSADFEVEIGSWGDIGGAMGLSLSVLVWVNVTLTDDTARFEIRPITQVGVDLEKMGAAGYFGEASQFMSMLSSLGIYTSVKISATGSVEFYYDFVEEAITVDYVGLRLTASLDVTVNIIKLVLAVAVPEVEPIVSQIVSLIDKFSGYNVYDIIVTKFGVKFDFAVQYWIDTDRWVADAQLSMTFDVIRLNLIQPKDGDVDELVIGLFGEVGIHYDSGTKAFSTCGGMDFYITFDLRNAKGGFKTFVETLAALGGLSTTTSNVWELYRIGVGSCTPIAFGPHSASDIVDEDSDYLTAEQEAEYGTSDLNPDTDGDGLWDFLEIQIGTDPLNWDTDDDGLSDATEYYETGTDPTEVDTDGDGLSDYLEVEVYSTDASNVDTDLDRLSDYDEIFIYGTDPLVDDTDGDGFKDGWEELWYETDSLDASDYPVDTDKDGLTDHDEIELFKTNPNLNEARDHDGDGLKTYQELVMYVGMDPYNPDTDGDGLSDKLELLHGCDYLEADTDGDGLADGSEVLVYGTDPGSADSDGDGYSDALEITEGTDPLDSTSYPGSAGNGSDLPADLLNTWKYVAIAFIAANLLGAAAFILKRRLTGDAAARRVARRVNGDLVPEAIPATKAPENTAIVENVAKAKTAVTGGLVKVGEGITSGLGGVRSKLGEWKQSLSNRRDPAYQLRQRLEQAKHTRPEDRTPEPDDNGWN